jgi:hypothetical protein
MAKNKPQIFKFLKGLWCFFFLFFAHFSFTKTPRHSSPPPGLFLFYVLPSSLLGPSLSFHSFHPWIPFPHSLLGFSHQAH